MRLWSNSSVQRGNGGFNPEKRLLAAVLQRAITDFLTGDGEIQLSARDWIFSDEDTSETFCFLYICEALDFNASELRKAVSRQLDRAILDAGMNSSTNIKLAKNTQQEATRPQLTPEMTTTMLGSQIAEKVLAEKVAATKVMTSQVVTVKSGVMQSPAQIQPANLQQANLSTSNSVEITKTEYNIVAAA